MNLALGVLLVAAVSLERRLVQASLASWLAFAAPPFAFHLGQVQHFSSFDNLMQLGALGFVVLLPLVLFLQMWPSRTASGRRTEIQTLRQGKGASRR
jgi:hypothetical protein